MANIVVLDEITANKIAAGEVVERPASVVKELVENALDAGSTQIKIDIAQGGAKSIQITDNGAGISPAEVQLAFQRHATSKITAASDLEAIRTLGFRGEALPSIAAVSRVTMTTRTNDKISGTKIEIHGGKEINFQEAGCPVGTTILVEDLFFNTPARKKHMKSLNVEAGHISDIVGRLAMVCPEVSFQLTSNGRQVLQTPGNGNTIEAIAAVYGLETARQMLELNYQDELLKIRGYLAKPVVSRSNRNHQSLYINKRFIRSALISNAIEEGYHTLHNIGRHPLVVMDLAINPHLVDVNVHPTKMEVRFSNESDLYTTISKVVRETLLGGEIIPEISIPVKTKAPKTEYVQEKIEISAPVVKESQPSNYSKPQPKLSDLKEMTELSTKVEEATNDSDNLPYMEPIGQIDATYIVAKGESGMFLIDQHAAHERILYEKFMGRAEEIMTQELLMPITLELTGLETQFLVNNILIFTDLGFKLEHFGGNTFLIRAVPQLLPGQDEKAFFMDLLDTLSGEKKTLTTSEIREKMLTTMACKAAIKANHRMSLMEMEELLQRLGKTKNPYTCPHGRPTIIHMSSYELEKKFKRVM